jgi:hypothetical protein
MDGTRAAVSRSRRHRRWMKPSVGVTVTPSTKTHNSQYTQSTIYNTVHNTVHSSQHSSQHSASITGSNILYQNRTNNGEKKREAKKQSLEQQKKRERERKKQLQSSTLDHPHQHPRTERRDVARLEHKRAPRSDSWRHLVCRQVQREVERRHHQHGAARVPPRHQIPPSRTRIAPANADSTAANVRDIRRGRV